MLGFIEALKRPLDEIEPVLRVRYSPKTFAFSMASVARALFTKDIYPLYGQCCEAVIHQDMYRYPLNGQCCEAVIHQGHMPSLWPVL